MLPNHLIPVQVLLHHHAENDYWNIRQREASNLDEAYYYGGQIDVGSASTTAAQHRTEGDVSRFDGTVNNMQSSLKGHAQVYNHQKISDFISAS